MYNECPQEPVPSLSENKAIGIVEEVLNQTSPVNSCSSNNKFVVSFVNKPSNKIEKSNSDPSLPACQTGEGSIVPEANTPEAEAPSPRQTTNRP